MGCSILICLNKVCGYFQSEVSLLQVLIVNIRADFILDELRLAGKLTRIAARESLQALECAQVELPLLLLQKIEEWGEEDVWRRDGNNRRIIRFNLSVCGDHSQALESGFAGQLIGHTVSKDAVVAVKDLLAQDWMGCADKG